MRPPRCLVLVSSFALGVAVVSTLLLGRADVARAIGPRDRHLTSLRHGIAVEAPAGWTLSQHTGYGDTVVLLLHPDGSRISLSAAATTAADAGALYEQNRKGLLAQKLSPGAPQPGSRGFLAVDITTPDRPDRLRQLYLVRSTASGKQAVILTLVSRASAFSVHTAALDFVANRLTFDEPTPPTAATKAQGAIVPKLALGDVLTAGTGGAGAGGTAGTPPLGSSSDAPSPSPHVGAGGSSGQLRSHDR